MKNPPNDKHNRSQKDIFFSVPDEIEKKVKEIIIKQIGIKAEQITEKMLLVDHPKYYRTLIEFEDVFEMNIPDEDIVKIQTIGDAIKYIEERKKIRKSNDTNISDKDAEKREDMKDAIKINGWTKMGYKMGYGKWIKWVEGQQQVKKLNKTNPDEIEKKVKEIIIKQIGTVKWFNDRKGFGFITQDNGEDVFVHHTAIKGEGYRSLSPGDKVEFETTQDAKGLIASNVVKIVKELNKTNSPREEAKKIIEKAVANVKYIEEHKELRKPEGNLKMRKFRNIETYEALCRIGSEVENSKVENSVELDKSIKKEVAQEFEKRIKEQAESCSPKQALDWCGALFWEPFVEYVVNREEILNGFINPIKKAIKSSGKSSISEGTALDWLKFVKNVKIPIGDANRLIAECVQDINGEEMSQIVAKEVCEIFRKFKPNETQEAKVYDALNKLALQGRSVWGMDSFRQAVWACLTKKPEYDKLVSVCMSKMLENIKKELNLFKTWSNVYMLLKEAGIKTD